jgi:trimeric autotransporter adhesin
MKTTKKLFFALAVAALVAPTLESCKKGEEDPGLSFRSRRNRVAGEWKVIKWDEVSRGTNNNTNTNSSGTTTSSSSWSQTIAFDGANIKVTYTNNSGVSSVSGTGEMTYTFEKDGTFKATSKTKIVSVETDSGSGYSEKETTTTDETVTYTGTWNFMGGVGDEVSSKEALVMSYTQRDVSTTEVSVYEYTITSTGTTYTSTTTTTSTSKYSYASTDVDETWMLKRLANKEIKAFAKVKRSGSGNSTSTTVSGSSSSTSSSTFSNTYEADITLELENIE